MQYERLERGKVADNQTRQTCHVDYYTTIPQRGEEGWLICTSCQMQRVDNMYIYSNITSRRLDFRGIATFNVAIFAYF